MTDNIMPRNYFRSLIPELASADLGLRIFWEQKANLTLRDLRALRSAGVHSIQPGIESLSTSVLRRMAKGVSAARNLLLLRDARAVGVDVVWNLMYAVPGDGEDDYLQILELIPLLAHLQPPSLVRLVVQRFSPYFERAHDFGVRNVRPLESYSEVFPETADCGRLGYAFEADYEHALSKRPALLADLQRAVSQWQDGWRKTPPTLRVGLVDRYSRDGYRLRDTRGLPGTRAERALSEDQARAALLPRPFARIEHGMVSSPATGGRSISGSGPTSTAGTCPLPRRRPGCSSGSGRIEPRRARQAGASRARR